MLRFIILYLLIASSCTTLYAQNYRLQNAEVRFEIKNAGFTVKGKFDSIPAIQLTMQGGSTGKMALSGTVSAASINTGIGIRDKHLRKPDYFDTEKYPQITLQSTGITKNGKEMQGNFNLQMKQTTRAITMAITMTEKGNLVEMNGTFTINRKDFGVGGNSMTLADYVDIFVHAVFEK